LITVYRLESKIAVENKQAFLGQGSVLSDGRWHTSPRKIVYCAGDLSLAVLEIRVNTMGVKTLPTRYLVTTQIKENQIFELTSYPKDWRTSPANSSTQLIGNDWYDENTHLVLKVKSSIVPEAFNYLINANHPEFTKLTVTSPTLYDLDSRLWK